MMKILLAQNNPTIADFDGNVNQIISSIQVAKESGCKLVITSELALCGYPAKDLLYNPDFLSHHQQALDVLKPHTKGLVVLVGGLRHNSGIGPKLFNSCHVFEDGKLTKCYDKWLLPTYDVFDEKRYFQEGQQPLIIEIEGKKIALSICEDIWFNKSMRYPLDPLDLLADQSIDLLVNLSASPFETGKLNQRIELCQKAAKKIGGVVALCNQVGGNDSLIFDGHSFVTDEKQVLTLAKGFVQSDLIFELGNSYEVPSFPPRLQQLHDALVLGIKDYFHKQGFKKAILGLSGGIDSALVCALATKALGSDQMLAISMPSRFSSDHSVSDAEKLAKNLGIKLMKVPIESVHASYLKLFEEPFRGQQEDVTEENIQSRIRGMVLMAFSNKFGGLVISCGNKSEMAMGYATLYGDLTGGLSAIGDVTKTEVYELARWMNKDQELIPSNIIAKDPSAELRPNQKDADSLPCYDELDAIISDYLEKHLDVQSIAKNHSLDLDKVQRIIQQIQRSEYKRSQTPIGLKVSSQSFSIDWQYPIVHKMKP